MKDNSVTGDSNMELKEATVPTRPDHIMDTQWGRITYSEWCAYEKVRREAKGFTVEIRTVKTRGLNKGHISLWANKITE